MSETPTAFPTFGSPMLAGEAAVRHAAASLFSSRDGHAVVQGIVETAHALTRADAALLLLTDGATGEFVPAVPGVAVGLDQRWLEGQGLQGALQPARQAATARQVVVHSLAHDRPAPSALNYPLLTGGRRAAGVCAASAGR